ncbi:SusC/RagA family TonB-linked outer membrane protein, partial [Phocaeicola vulgatus]
MLKRLQSVSMVLFLGTLFSGTISTATASGANSFATTQQAGICKGLVKDATGESVIGASVVVKGTTNGTITDFDGNFSLDGIKKGDVIVISYVGYQTQEIKWNGSPLNVILKEDSKTLSEVVVVGYGTQKKANLSGSVAMVDSKELENRPIQNVSSGLQGLMPGVAITGTNGAPGQDAGKIRVRGIGTLNEAGPYILVDGIETGTLSAVDPNDIESISVLKDAASAAIYGSKAANGVVLITTKRGKTGQTKISYSGYLSFQNATNMIERMGSYEYASLLNQALEAEGMSKRFNDTELQKFKDGNDPLYPDTDWYDLAYKTGVQHRHNVNINGGSENVKYMASLGYLNQTGILPNAGREQFNARTNLDMKINKRLSARMNLSFIKNDYSDASSAYYGGSSDQIIRQLNLIAPWIVARYDDGTWGTISDGSPIAWLDSGMKVNRDNYNFSGMAAVDYEIFDGLKLTLQGAYVNNLQNYNYFQKYIKYNENKESDPSQLDERFYKWDRTNYDALLNYNKNFGKHNIKGLLGWHTEKYNYKYQKAVRKKFPNNE